ncbi:MAG: hypothetical protein JSV23_08040 [Promethearchaeota archaeon]|nr:MAG: hypothetical protein JSV23_08040 [Candidatus Lokiarchaeota archaeon]
MLETSKRISKYRNLLIIYVIYIIFWIIIVGILSVLIKPTARIALTRFSPSGDLLLELGLIFIIILPLSALIGLIIGGYLITPIILYLHKKIYGSKKYYGIQFEPRLDKIKIFSKSFFPVLMAINLSFIFLTPPVLESIVSDTLLTAFNLLFHILTRFFGEIILLTLTLGLATMFFSSVWFLKDSGIIYSNKKKIVNSNELIVLRSIGDWYQTILRSYAGIAAIITYILVVQDFFTRYIENFGVPENVYNIPSLILWLGLPFYLAISLIPALIVNDLIKKKRIKFVRKIGEKLGIKDTAIITFELRKDNGSSEDITNSLERL